MKSLYLAFLWFGSAVLAGATTDATVRSLIGREFFIEDDFAGQSFVLRSKGDVVEAEWRIWPSGSTTIVEHTYPVDMLDERSCRFFVALPARRPQSPPTEVKIDLHQLREIRIFANGLRVHARERKNEPNK